MLQRLMQRNEACIWLKSSGGGGAVVREAIFGKTFMCEMLSFSQPCCWTCSSSRMLYHIDCLTLKMKALRFFETSITETSHLLEGPHASSVCPSGKSSVKDGFYGAILHDNGKGNRRSRRKTSFSAILSTTNPTPTLLVSDPGLLVERRKTDCLNHGMAFLKPEIHVK